MSLVGDVLTALEAKVRVAVPSLPAGTLGVERGWRPAHELTDPGSLPHCFLYGTTERQELLIFRQVRSTVAVSGLIVRVGSTEAQALEDYEALSDAIELDPTLGGAVEQSTLALDGVESEQGGAARAIAFSFVGVKVLS